MTQYKHGQKQRTVLDSQAGRRMRARSLIGEAWRDIVTGTAHAAMFAAICVVAIGAGAFLDARSMVGILHTAHAFQSSGAATHVLKSDNNVDGARCDALSSATGVTAAGAIRQGTQITALAMPDSPITVVEATPGLIPMLPIIANPWQSSPATHSGIWLSADLAKTLGATPGQTLKTTTGTTAIAGIYTWPDDGRARDLGFAAVVPVPAQGTFSQCWAQIWPANANAASWLYTSLIQSNPSQGTQTTLGQLNQSLGTTYDATAQLEHRLTARVPWLAALIGLAIGYASMRLRRLEVASNLHSRVSKVDLAWQYMMETVVWAVVGMVVTGAVLLWAATAGNPDTGWTTWLTAMRTVVAGGVATGVGAVVAVTITREKHLFRYAKDR